MTLKFRKNAVKFLESLDEKTREKIRQKIKILVYSVDHQAIIPFNDLDIKKMKGNWEGFYRLRIGTIRVIFTVDLTSGNIEVYRIGFRGDVYQ
ncbi:type II toxin-antitoxin system RelE/ParE family toxin [Crocosphaera sp. UHCC 0190]|uniref:type II toxin-antitoxin system RelE family toxin n=1 Tax=Crocosphaera sp. UHCC 0190 TaxID=3110246 RepID=UPI002B1ED5E7|nr:type II toxin-antitoxin system RelE/ParE family toxin [Crocosphaera sp. UHCC 0190]MEA5511376.1 type II toxin-antitoxin system RelE/ParE family toxin [Crocosphaera sp. UHCC 0190]